MKRFAVAILSALECVAALAGDITIPHNTPGGVGGIVRAQFGLVAVGKDPNGVPSTCLPVSSSVYVMPLEPRFDEAAGALYQLQADNTVTVLASGLYRVVAMVDWTGQAALDYAPRKISIGRMSVGGVLTGWTEGSLVNVRGESESYDILAAADIPASPTGRSSDAWHTLSTPTVQLEAGERVFLTAKSITAGDCVQRTNQTYLQLEQMAVPTAVAGR